MLMWSYSNRFVGGGGVSILNLVETARPTLHDNERPALAWTTPSDIWHPTIRLSHTVHYIYSAYVETLEKRVYSGSIGGMGPTGTIPVGFVCNNFLRHHLQGSYPIMGYEPFGHNSQS